MPEMSTRPVVLLIAAPPAFGGSNRSVANFMAALRPAAVCVLASPSEGKFLNYVTERDLFDEHLPLPFGGRVSRFGASLRIAWWAMRNRHRLTVIHAQATTGLHLAALAAFLTRRPVVVRVSDAEGSQAGRRLGPWVRRMVPRLTVLPVSETARDIAVANGLCTEAEAIIIPEPVVPEDVVALERTPTGGALTIGFLGGATYRKGFDLLPAVVDGVSDLPARWVIYASVQEDNDVEEAAAKLLSREDGLVEFHKREVDVRRVYAKCDIVFVPSRSESFCLVVAEAMANGIAVVGSDLDPIKRLLGDDEAGLLFASGQPSSAIAALRRVIEDPVLRLRLGAAGRIRAAAYAPAAVFQRLAPFYGLQL
jgi:phosphatidyl-myo-inositol alpha-mannosyltransferase